jgi:uncharacterized membrane protein YccF (DUF307 family)
MKTIGNILWLIFAGLGTALGWLLWSALLAITVVGLPFARQCLKLARLTLWPFGRTVIKSPNAATLGPIGNVLWFIPGVFMSIGYALAGVALCITIIGIPFGIQSFKFISLALMPFGKEVVRTKDVTAGMAVALQAEDE